ncbi:MAG: peptide-methionine (S)-S-oxide reductase [Propionibacterium sp.]|nr:MAG: peptide-methionine (S)-S-oxide reductase [Propionibacterium sp.]
MYWEQTGVVNTAVGFMGGHVANPTYAQCCTGTTGHAETVQLVFDPQRISYPRLLQLFWENHDPTTADRQGPDIGTQYRSAIFTTSDAQQAAALASREVYQRALMIANRGTITTTIAPAGDFYHAHAEHQQYLHKNPWRPSCHLGTGIACLLPDGFDQA